MKSPNRIALFTSAAALGASMLLPAAFAAQSAPATVPVHKAQKKENANITAARQSLRDARNPAHAGARAVEDLNKTWDNLRKAGFSPDVGEGFARIGITEQQYLDMKHTQIQHAIDDAIRDSQLPENAGLPALAKLEAAQDYSFEHGSYPKSDLRIFEMMSAQYRAAARQELEQAVLTRHDDPIGAVKSIALMDEYLNHGLDLDRNTDIYTVIGSSKEIVHDIKNLVITEAARKNYDDALAAPHKGLASFQKMSDVLSTLNLLAIARGKGEDELTAYLAHINVTPDEFLMELRLQGQAAANEILQKATEPEFMGLQETTDNLQLLPWIIEHAGLGEPPKEEVLGREINNMVARTNRHLEEARKPENKGPKALIHLQSASNILFLAGESEPDPVLAHAYQHIETIVSDYSQLYNDNHLAVLKHNLQRAREPANAGDKAAALLSNLRYDLQDLYHGQSFSYALAKVGLTESGYDALEKQNNLIAAKTALQSTRDAIRQRSAEAFAHFSRLQHYLNLVGHGTDDGLKQLHLTKGEYKALHDQSEDCIRWSECRKPTQSPASPEPR